MPPAAGPGVVPCGICSKAWFCNASCADAAAADPASHCPLVCRSLSSLNFQGLSEDQQTALHFLTRAASLALAAQRGDAAAAARCAQLTSLAPRSGDAAAGPDAFSDVQMQELCGRLSHALAAAGAGSAASPIFSLAEVGALLERDAVNGYGILAPTQLGERRLRGAGLYSTASRINHECLPNVARFDAFDSPVSTTAPGTNTAICFRALHALPAGEEITQSYFPLTWMYQERQQRCAEHYGFHCNCPRCKEEASWPPGDGDPGSDGDASMGAEGDTGMEEDAVEGTEAAISDGAREEEEGEADAAYIHVFLLKYVCPSEGCEGTMAPLPAQPEVTECSMCGRHRTEAEFMAELERDMQSA